MSYAKNGWNALDASGSILFCTGMGFRLASLFTENEEFFTISR